MRAHHALAPAFSSPCASSPLAQARHPKHLLSRRGMGALLAVLIAHSLVLGTPRWWWAPPQAEADSPPLQVHFLPMQAEAPAPLDAPAPKPASLPAERASERSRVSPTLPPESAGNAAPPASPVPEPQPEPEPQQDPPADPVPAPAIALTTAALASAQLGVAEAAPNATPPANAKLLFDVTVQSKGLSLSPSGELLWQHDGSSYNARLSLNHLFFSRTQSSRGKITATGLQPIRFGDKVKSEVAAHFDWSAGKVTFSANTPDVALTPTTQDQLSALVQLGALLAAAPQHAVAGSVVRMAAIGPRSEEQWEFTVVGPETLQLPGGTHNTLKVTRAAAVPYGNRAELWLAPALGYLPVRIRLIESNGDTADMQWKDTQRP